jgi:hypothetical protein
MRLGDNRRLEKKLPSWKQHGDNPSPLAAKAKAQPKGWKPSGQVSLGKCGVKAEGPPLSDRLDVWVSSRAKTRVEGRGAVRADVVCADKGN